MTFAIGDVVRVAKQPPDLPAKVIGEVGFIDSLHENGTHAGILALNVDGSLSGGGTVQLDCLVLESAPHWVQAKRLHDEAQAKRLDEYKSRSDRINTGLQKIASEFGITPEQADEIHQKVHHLIERDGWPE